MPPREDLILILDLETTGTDEMLDSIIEFGAVMLDADTLKELGAIKQTLLPWPDSYQRMMDNKVVREMHEKNGLLEEINVALEHDMLTGSGEWAGSFDARGLKEWVDRFTGGNTTHIPYGGSGVGHFDRKFIREQLPLFDKRITFWSYDVGVMRRMFAKAGAPVLEGTENKTHRALDDARFHADELRYYLSKIRGD